jgi:predicted transcriptional regulator
MQRGTKRYGVGAAVTDRNSGSNVTTRLVADEFKELDAIARRYDVSRSALARQAIREFLARSDAPDAETGEKLVADEHEISEHLRDRLVAIRED